MQALGRGRLRALGQPRPVATQRQISIPLPEPNAERSRHLRHVRPQRRPSGMLSHDANEGYRW